MGQMICDSTSPQAQPSIYGSPDPPKVGLSCRNEDFCQSIATHFFGWLGEPEAAAGWVLDLKPGNPNSLGAWDDLIPDNDPAYTSQGWLDPSGGPSLVYRGYAHQTASQTTPGGTGIFGIIGPYGCCVPQNLPGVWNVPMPLPETFDFTTKGDGSGGGIPVSIASFMQGRSFAEVCHPDVCDPVHPGFETFCSSFG